MDMVVFTKKKNITLLKIEMLAKIVSFLRCNIYIGTIVTNFVIQKIFSSVKRLVIEIMLFSIFI